MARATVTSKGLSYRRFHIGHDHPPTPSIAQGRELAFREAMFPSHAEANAFVSQVILVCFANWARSPTGLTKTEPK